jgi:hypothetical protein
VRKERNMFHRYLTLRVKGSASSPVASSWIERLEKELVQDGDSMSLAHFRTGCTWLYAIKATTAEHAFTDAVEDVFDEMGKPLLDSYWSVVSEQEYQTICGEILEMKKEDEKRQAEQDRAYNALVKEKNRVVRTYTTSLSDRRTPR